MTPQKIYIGSDHRGVELKSLLLEFLEKKGFEVHEVGSKKYDPADDYPDLAKSLSQKILKDKGSMGIIICGSGAGVCIAANRLKGIRAVETHDVNIAKASRKDDDTNVLCLGSDFIVFENAKEVVLSWINESFEKAARRLRRINKLDNLA